MTSTSRAGRARISVATILVGLASVLPAPASDAPVPPPPRKAAYFNVPTSGAGAPGAPSPITQRLVELIDAAETKATIRIAVYYILDARPAMRQALVASELEDADQGGQLVGALIRALQRGARVQVVTEAVDTDAVRALARLRAAGARVVRCRSGCAYRKRGAVMHNKFMLIDNTTWTDGYERVVVQMSANWSDKQLSNHWFNNMLVIWDDVGLYRGYRRYYDGLWARRATGVRSATGDRSEGAAATFSPRRRDPVLEQLSGSWTRCAPGSSIDVAMSTWTTERGRTLLRALQARARAGCRVRVVVPEDQRIVTSGLLVRALGDNAHCTGNSSTAAEIDPDVFAGDPTLSLRPANHSKYVLVNSTYGSIPDARVVFTGSMNFTDGGLKQNDESWVKVLWHPAAPVENALVFASYSTDFERMWRSSTPCSARHNGLA